MNVVRPLAATLSALFFSLPSPAQESTPPAQPPPEKPAAQPEKPKTPPPAAPPSLDDLLGIKPKTPLAAPETAKPADAKPSVDSTIPSPDQNQTDLNRLLSAAEMGDAFKQAIELMGDASTRLNTHRDAGLDTQRVQEDVIRRLDQLIASMEKQKQQSSPSPKPQDKDSKQQPPPKPGQKPDKPEESKPDKGDGKTEHLGPTLKEGQLKPELESARAAWGSLPQRVRDMLMQGTEDRFSARYKALTQEYYKRLAEENSK